MKVPLFISPRTEESSSRPFQHLGWFLVSPKYLLIWGLVPSSRHGVSPRTKLFLSFDCMPYPCRFNYLSSELGSLKAFERFGRLNRVKRVNSRSWEKRTPSKCLAWVCFLVYGGVLNGSERKDQWTVYLYQFSVVLSQTLYDFPLHEIRISLTYHVKMGLSTFILRPTGSSSTHFV